MCGSNGVVGSPWVRQLHRWVAVVFTVTVIANFIVRANGEPPVWVTYSPLPPRAVLLLTGLYMFVLPHVHRGLNRGRA
jgi:hypothetical protein